MILSISSMVFIRPIRVETITTVPVRVFGADLLIALIMARLCFWHRCYCSVDTQKLKLCCCKSSSGSLMSPLKSTSPWSVTLCEVNLAGMRNICCLLPVQLFTYIMCIFLLHLNSLKWGLHVKSKVACSWLVLCVCADIFLDAISFWLHSQGSYHEHNP